MPIVTRNGNVELLFDGVTRLLQTALRFSRLAALPTNHNADIDRTYRKQFLDNARQCIGIIRTLRTHQ